MSIIEECYGQRCILAFAILGKLWSHWEGYNARIHLLDTDLTDVHINIYGKNKLSFLFIIMTSNFVL